jgi:uncharacterized protein (DUF302 family)
MGAMSDSELGMSVRLDADYDEVLERVPPALKEEGFGVLTEIDVKETLKKKLDVDFRRYKILGACSPPHAHRALSTDLAIGLLLPCNVVVYEDGDGTVVSAIDPMAMLPTDDPAMKELADDVQARLKRAVESLSA